MDRNSIIGLSLIAVLLLLYFYVFSPAPMPVEPTPASNLPKVEDSTAVSGESTADSLSLQQDYGKLSTALVGELKPTQVENEDLAVTFLSNGSIGTVELKKYKTYLQEPLLLTEAGHSRFALRSQFDGKEIDLYQLRYELSTSTKGDTSVVQYTARVEGGFVRHTYLVPAAGYQIRYNLETNGIALNGEYLTYQWSDRIPLKEKALDDSRSRTTANYYTLAGDFDDISQSSLDAETITIAEPVKWVSVREKFFINAIIASNRFVGGEVSTDVPDKTDLKTVKHTNLKLFIPKEDVSSGKAKFTYFFGPNEYSLLGNVTPGFSENLDLGFPPVSWVNMYVIIPIFNFLEKFIGNYGVIIIILVLIIKLILTPLSYKSYLGMAKMRLLKPELDLIKEKNGDNLAQTQQDQMKLYQQAGVNPFSGCIPLLLQMPILFAMFYFFPVSIQLRQQRFLWAEDLSTYDSVLQLPFTIPYYGAHVSLFVLLMTASTLVYQWQNNQLSAVQGPMKSMSYIMPVIFMFLLNQFSAGLSFYYFVSNLVTFGQQAIIRKFVDEEKILAVMEDHKKKMASGNGAGKKSKFMTKLEEAMKASEETRKKNSKK